jgi:uncharacterized protein YraI
MGRSITSPPKRGPHCTQMAAASTAGGRSHLSYAFLVTGFAALLSACGEQATVTQQARLHKAPATQSEVVAVIPKGSKVDASGCSDGWCQVKWNGKQGYALAKVLHTRSSGSAPAAEGREDDMYGGESAETDAD